MPERQKIGGAADRLPPGEGCQTRNPFDL